MNYETTNTKDEILFSVIIPTYNRAEKIKFCLDSLVNQSYKCFEVIVCDDGSTDNTKEIVALYENKLDLKYIWEENWGGPARPRNNGIKITKGKWICFLDSDDWWHPDKLQSCFELANDKVDLIYHDLFIRRSNKQAWFDKRIVSTPPKHPMFSAFLCTDMSIPNSSVVVRRELLTRIGGISEDRDLISVEDYDTWIRLSKLTDRFVRAPQCLGYYWVSGSSISTASSMQILRIKILYSKYMDELPAAQRQQAEGFLAYRIGRIAQLQGDYATAHESLLKALRHPIDFAYRSKAVYFLACNLLQRLTL